MNRRKISEKEQKKAARDFATYWKDKGYEKGQSQLFWLELLDQVYGVEDPTRVITFEDQVMMDHTSFIDGRIPETKVLIEQKSLGKDLGKAIKQSDGSMLTPFQQAKRYSAELPYSQRPRWIVTSNFSEFRIYDMEKPNGEPEIIQLKDLPKEFYRMNFLVDSQNENIKREMEVSLKAGEIVGKLYEALLDEYKDPDDPKTLENLNILCVRLVFLLYAEDAQLLGSHLAFHDYLLPYKDNGAGARRALIRLFKILDTKPEDRDPYEDEELLAFPYVNGGLFANEDVVIPKLNNKILNLILKNASEDFDWSTISPTIFGAVFEATLNPETRRSGGMHYTSLENIHKVIDPLFLDDLKEEFERIKDYKIKKIRNKKLVEFQNKLTSLKFLDPAAGSGNFLTETFICLRRLENEIIKLLNEQQALGFIGEEVSPIKVSIESFNGIEINDFAVTVAKTALWIAESQMLKETEEILLMDIDFFPLKTQANIIEGNALRIDWNDVVDKNELSYIMGNPPFVGYSLQSKLQKNDIQRVFVDPNGKEYKGCGKIDYVAGWFFKVAEYLFDSDIQAALVATNSITQGEQVALIWRPILDRFKCQINFAHRTFIWDSEASLKAHVHCVIIGFSPRRINKPKRIYSNNRYEEVKSINPYLLSGETILIDGVTQPLFPSPAITKGFQATDNGYLILNEKEFVELIKKEPAAQKWIRPYSMGVEFINNIPRYCLWLYDITPHELQRLPIIKDRVAACRKWRSNSVKTGDAYKLKDVPHLFRPCKQFKDEPYIAIPLVSSINRKYMPMGYVNNGMIPGNNLFSVFGANLYHFGILTSNVHMAWIRVVGGRLKSDWRYSKNIVYNNFPWPNPTEAQKAKIEKTAQAILDARDLYPDSSLADLYDDLTMPPELRKAHQSNDRAVMEAYGFSVKDMTESKCIEELFKLYQKKVAELEK